MLPAVTLGWYYYCPARYLQVLGLRLRPFGSMRWYPRQSSITNGGVEKLETKLAVRKEIQGRVKERLTEALGEEVEDMGALVKKFDQLNLNHFCSQPIYYDWTVEAITRFFTNKYPTCMEKIQFIDLQEKQFAPVKWLVVIPVENPRMRSCIYEDLFTAFNLTKADVYGDPIADQWVLVDLKTIYMHLMSVEEMERLDLLGWWSTPSSAEPTEPKLCDLPLPDPNFIPRKILKIAKKIEYETKKKIVDRKKEAKKIKTYTPTSISIKSSSFPVPYLKKAVKKTDKRLIEEAKYKHADGNSHEDVIRGSFDNLASINVHDDFIETEQNQPKRQMNDEFSCVRTTSPTSKHRNRIRRRYTAALAKYQEELAAHCNELNK